MEPKPVPITLDSLFARWKEARDAGNLLTPEQLCSEAPELLPQLIARIAAEPSPDRATMPADTIEGRSELTPESDHPALGRPSGDTTVTRVSKAPLVQGDVTGTHHPGKPSYKPTPPNIPGFEVGELLGIGGMGEVWKVEKVSLGTRITYAMKVLRSNQLGQSAYQRFAREAKTLVDLQHDNIVRIFEFGETDDIPYLTMRYLPGGTLSSRIDEWKRKIPESVALITIITKAVSYAQQRGIVHRDIKPGNVLFDERGRPYLADFGIICEVNDPISETPPNGTATNPSNRRDRTTTGTVLGTPDYMPPEQWAGDIDRIKETADVYALGVMLYELTVGNRPFRIGNITEARADAPTRTFVPPREANPAIDPLLGTIIDKCLQANPAERYKNAEELGRALEHREQRGIRRKRMAWIAAIMMLFLLVGTAIAVFRPFAEKQQEAIDPEKYRLEQEAALARGEKVTLIGETGLPKWYKIQAGEEDTLIRPTMGDLCTIDCQYLSLVELCRDPMSDHYRIEAEVRQHGPLGRHSRIGVYFFYQRHGEKMLDHFFTSWLMTEEVEDPVEPPPKGFAAGRAEFMMRTVHWIPPGNIQQDQILGAILPLLTPLKAKPEERWHKLKIEVEGLSILLSLDGKPLRRITQHELQKVFFEGLDPGVPPRPILSARGGIGLYVRASSACVRNVVLTPNRN